MTIASKGVATMTEVLKVTDLKVGYQSEDNEPISIVNGVSLHLHKGETLGIVGESGCGKSMTSYSLLGLLPMGIHWQGGQIELNKQPIDVSSKKQWRSVRGKQISMIFQEPMSSLNPVHKIGSQIVEMIRNHEKISKKAAYEKAVEILKLVGIPRPEKVVDEYPHQLSGGMRQRVMIAIALACSPEILIADEPTTALDVTIQAQILELMKNIQSNLGMSIVLITHDLGVIAEMCDRVVVMYAGEVVEEATVLDLFDRPKHPYTKGLLNSLPKAHEKQDRLSTIEGVVPAPHNMPAGCRFYDRCEFASAQCLQKPQLIQVDAQKVRCWLYNPEHAEVVI